jgi:hypothetical protein
MPPAPQAHDFELPSEGEFRYYFSGGGLPSESEGHPLVQRQQRRRRCV